MEDNPHKRISPYLVYFETKKVTDDYCEQMDKITVSVRGGYVQTQIYASCIIYEASAQQDLSVHARAKQTLDGISTRVPVGLIPLYEIPY